MKKLIFVLLLFTVANAWRTTIDSSQIRNFFRFYKFPNDQFLFVNSSDSTFDTAGVVAEKFGIRDITFPQLISFDTAYGGCYVYVPNSDQALLLSAGTTTWNPDSGAYIAIEGMNTGATGDLFMATGNIGSVNYYTSTNFKIFNGVDTLMFFYSTGDGFVIKSDRIEIVGRDGVGHGLVIDSQYVLIHDTLLITDFIANDERTGFLFFDEYGNIGNGTTTPIEVLSYTYATTSHMLNVYEGTDAAHFVLQGNIGAHQQLVDLGGAANDRWFRLSVDNGVAAFKSRNDDASARVDDILVMDMGTGNVGIGTNTPSQVLDIVSGVYYRQIVIADNVTNTTAKRGAISGHHYTIAEEPIGLIGYYSDASQTIVSIGGGLGATADLNSATEIQFHTAANTTTTNTTASMMINSAGNVTFGYDVSVTGDIDAANITADSIYGTKIGTNAAVACSLKDGSTLRATGTALWHRIGKTLRIQIPELSGTVTSGQTARIYFPASTTPLPATLNVYKTIWVNNGDPLVACACLGGTNNIVISTSPSLGDFGNVTLTVNEFVFEYIVY